MFSIFLRPFTVNEEFHRSRSGLCDNYIRRRLEVSKKNYAISDCAILLKRDIVSSEKPNNIDNTCKEVKSILGLFQSQREELQYPLF